MKNQATLLLAMLFAGCMTLPKVTENRGDTNPSNMILQFPFDARTMATCTYSGGTHEHWGTHKNSNSYWAVDLATPYDSPAAIVLASYDGIAFVMQDADGNPTWYL